MTALMTFESHIKGKNATVEIHRDRIEWEQKGKITAGRLMTAGAFGLRKGGGSEMIPIKAITSVTTNKDGWHWAVSIIAPGNTVDMRVTKDEAGQIKQTLQNLMLQSA